MKVPDEFKLPENCVEIDFKISGAPPRSREERLLDRACAYIAALNWGASHEVSGLPDWLEIGREARKQVTDSVRARLEREIKEEESWRL